MTIDELQKMIANDSKLDITKLEEDSLNVPYLYGKYIVIHANEKRILRALKKSLLKLKRDKTAYYRGDADPEVYAEKPLNVSILKTQVPDYVESDDEVMDMVDRVEAQEIKLEMLAEFLKAIYQRTFHIKNAIDYMKFKNGVT